MKIASYNVENLFDRARAFNEETPEAQQVIKQVAKINILLEKEVYSDNDKENILVLLGELDILKSDEGKYVRLRRIRGKFLKRSRRSSSTSVEADGRADWVGWVEHKMSHINEIAIMNTGRVLRDVDADIVAVIEAEHRVALKQFSDYVLSKVGGHSYDNVMLIDGNDDRGIDVGLLTKSGYDIGLMRSHVHDLDEEGNLIYSRDSPEYCITTPTGEELWIIPNHFKSKFGGNDEKSKKKRTAQSLRTAAIYQQLISDGHDKIVVLGDLNDTPDSPALQPLLVETDLKDVSDHPLFDTGAFAGKGTFGLGNDSNKLDYLLLSPALFDRVIACGLFRKGAWPGKRPKRWEVYPELEREIHVASDHHLIWCELM